MNLSKVQLCIILPPGKPTAVFRDGKGRVMNAGRIIMRGNIEALGENIVTCISNYRRVWICQ
jgi:hypothetical protein